MEVLDRKNRVAKKEHTCDLCGFKIATGEKYDWQKMYRMERYTNLRCICLV